MANKIIKAMKTFNRACSSKPGRTLITAAYTIIGAFVCTKLGRDNFLEELYNQERFTLCDADGNERDYILKRVE